MFHTVKKAWSDIVLSLRPRPRRRQVAALCYRMSDEGKQVLLVTSRGTGRWIVPKGWPVPGKDGPGSALQEAWEEAGVSIAEIEPSPVGQYDYAKGLANGASIPIETQVYLTHVTGLKDAYPEADERCRAWFSPQEAADLVHEGDLKAILRAL